MCPEGIPKPHFANFERTIFFFVNDWSLHVLPNIHDQIRSRIFKTHRIHNECHLMKKCTAVDPRQFRMRQCYVKLLIYCQRIVFQYSLVWMHYRWFWYFNNNIELPITPFHKQTTKALDLYLNVFPDEKTKTSLYS